MNRASPTGGLPLSSPSPFSGIVGVRGYLVGDIGGVVVGAHHPSRSSEEVVAAAAVIRNTFTVVGTLLGMGDIEKAVARADANTWIVGFRTGYSISVELEAQTPTTNIERIATSEDWVPVPEWEVTDSEIAYVNPIGNLGAKPGTTPGTAPAAVVPVPAKPETRRSPAQPSPVRVSTTSATPGESKASPNMASANARGLRKALIRGDLSGAIAIAEHLRDAFPSDSDPCGSGKSAQAIGPLITGIAAVLSGDMDAALEQLGAVGRLADIGPSLLWVSQVWSSRASVATTEGLTQALTLAEAAGRLSKQLDIEARLVSARLVAEVCLHRNNLDHAERFAEQARKLSESLADRDESGEISLLQAKILRASGKNDQAIHAAERAHAYRQSWIAPVTFLCRCALTADNLKRAEGLLARFTASDAQIPEVARLARLLNSVRQTELPAAIAAEFLDLEDAPADSRCVARLAELAKQFPMVEGIACTLGWKLLKSGRRAQAAEIFEGLGQRHDLPDDLHSSVLLGLGYLASNRGKHSSTDAKMQAMVQAAPKHLQKARPATPSSGCMRAASPIDLVDIEPPPQSTIEHSKHNGKTVSTKASPNCPVFSGTLAQFSLPDVLEFLRAGQRTGTLICSSVRGVGAVHLQSGRITGAAAPNTKANNDTMSHLRAQAISAIAELHNWGDGEFVFDQQQEDPPDAGLVQDALDPHEVFQEIFKNLDVQSHCRQ